MCDSDFWCTWVLVLILHAIVVRAFSQRRFRPLAENPAGPRFSLTKSWDSCFHSFHNLLVLLMMARCFDVAVSALTFLAFMLTGSHGLLAAPLGDQVRVGLLTSQSRKRLYQTRRCLLYSFPDTRFVLFVPRTAPSFRNACAFPRPSSKLLRKSSPSHESIFSACLVRHSQYPGANLPAGGDGEIRLGPRSSWYRSDFFQRGR